MSRVFGFLNVYKEKGYTSHDVVAIIKKILIGAGLGAGGGKFKVGHTGTLDPAAEGVLPICIGKATKLADYAGDGLKRYRAVLKLGQTSDTQDDTGKILSESPVTATREEIAAAVSSFCGEIEQIPPMFSAVKIQGQRLYDIARRGEAVQRKPRTVSINSIDVLEFHDGKTLTLDILCSRGTYIRTLCHDIGEKLGCGGLMGSLVRTASGTFSIETALRIGQIKDAAENGSLCEMILPVEKCLPYGSVTAVEAAMPSILEGRKVGLESLIAFPLGIDTEMNSVSASRTLCNAHVAARNGFAVRNGADSNSLRNCYNCCGNSPEQGRRVFVLGSDGNIAGLYEYIYDQPPSSGGERILILKPLVMLANRS